MTQLRSRPYQGAPDITQIIEFMRSVRPTALLTEYPSIYEIQELLSLLQNQATTRLWLNDDDRLLGFAYVDAFHTLRFDIDWQTQNHQMENEILTWSSRCLKHKHPWLCATSHEADRERLAFLRQHHFVQCTGSILHMAYALQADTPDPSVPAGFTIRSVKGEKEAPAIAALHRAAFGTPHMAAEHRMNIMRRSDYDPSLDLVAVTNEGALAAYALGQVNEQEGEQGVAYADLFATHPRYRGNGLASALMLLLLKQLREKGYRVAKLSTDSHNQSMQHIARAAGFQRIGKTLRFKRLVE